MSEVVRIIEKQIYNAFFEKAHELYCIEEYREGTVDPARYKWEFGIDAFLAIEKNKAIPIYCDDTAIHTFMGIPVDFNRVDPACVKLWKEVTL